MRFRFFSSLLAAHLTIASVAAADPPAPPPGFRLVPSARVHIEDAPVPVRLEIHDRDWVAVCSAPCDRDLPLYAEYRIAGDGIRASTPFSLHGKPGSVITLQVDPARTASHTSGLVLLSAGSFVAAIGALVTLWEVDPPRGDAPVITSTPSSPAPGLAMIGVGAFFALVGALAFGSNMHSTVNQGDDVSAHALPAPSRTAPHTPRMTREASLFTVRF